MVTDPPPGNHTLRVEFLESDRLDTLDLPQDDGLCRLTESIEKALQSQTLPRVITLCVWNSSKATGSIH